VISNASTNTFITVNIVRTLVTTSDFFVGFFAQNYWTSPSQVRSTRQIPTSPTAALSPAALGAGNISNLSVNAIPVNAIELFGLPGKCLIRRANRLTGTGLLC
jgi:hypothetical protein